ncbi:phosphoenolpyruvate synthase [Alkaliphilus peptidifermentans]|uniref:Rifampicin phosphotransferase n=1 Tax=Alkaliphilus peptidifermentans DSM 18978 TaxID=1120976 RepID=A0A1G5G255_9FIRM|nr:phosphoenolpyruvate synthase [Alkaliphilus peptidifermentans]SCY45625.1 pyruvate, water dikinase [Alkaliphilus peptidifermentans DSM 18978]
MKEYVLSFKQINGTNLPEVGGKGANLGELSKIAGIIVPEGICVTTEAYKKIVEDNKELDSLMDQLSLLSLKDSEKIAQVSKKIRLVIEGTEIPKDIVMAISLEIEKLGEKHPYAVRSSATAEDLPLASFAGQQDTYLNILGIDSILEHIRRCWASLYTDRAVTYRIQNRFEHRKVYLSVVVQKMIFPEASGIMFTADPITGNRKVVSIDASFGLGEALVSGLVNADNYKVREENILEKKVATKKIAIYSLQGGGTEEREIQPQQQNVQTLTDEEILRLNDIGRRIEKYFKRPQDIEWCLFNGEFYIVQSRPITTLYPIPENDGKNRVYASMGHLQMMTEDIKPLGMSFCKMLSFWFGENLNAAGGRLFIDGTYDLASPIGRKVLITSTGKADILMKNALVNLMKRKDFVKTLPRGKGSINMSSGILSWIPPIIKTYRENNPIIIEELIAYNEKLILEMEERIKKLSGDELLKFILQDTKDLKATLTGPGNMSMMAIGGLVTNWVNSKMEKWLGEKNVVDILSKSVKNNVTSEMGLALLDVSCIVAKYPEVIEYFKDAKDDTFFQDLSKLKGGVVVKDAIEEYLKLYGMRCAGEIDITKPRWREKPTALIPMIISTINSSELNSSSIIFQQGLLEAEGKERDLLNRLEQLPGGKRKAKKAKKMFSMLRNFIGFREYPKYSFIKRFQIYKTALLKEVSLLVQKGLIKEPEDIFYLYFDELHEVIRTNRLDYSIINKRKADYEIYEKLTPPRVMTSEGEIITGEYNNGNIPEGALAGVAVSSGVIEGRARVVLKLEDANIEEGDILVTTYTDPSWTPLFVSVKGLVTEVGGLMTHGAVVTREYGIPGVVGVENATKLIKDGQRIRINGTEGYVELL